MKTFNVLVSSAGRRVALLDILRRSLDALHLDGAVLAADASPLSSAFHAADAAFHVPRCDQVGFVPAMLELCALHEVRLLVPTIDTELPVYAANRDRFDDVGTTIAVSAPEVVDIGMDKVRTHRWLTDAGLPTVRQAPVEDVRRSPDDWPFPLLVKPRRGSASEGVAIVADATALSVRTAGDEEFVVETIAPGTEHTIDVLVDRVGAFVCAVPRRRIEVRAGEVSKGVTVRSPQLEHLVRRAIRALSGAYGPLTIQVFVAPETGETNVIELNPRFGGGYPLAWEAGGRYPQWLIEELLGLTSTASADGWRDGLVMLRYDGAVFVEAQAVGLCAR